MWPNRKYLRDVAVSNKGGSRPNLIWMFTAANPKYKQADKHIRFQPNTNEAPALVHVVPLMDARVTTMQ
jgi:phospholipase C